MDHICFNGKMVTAAEPVLLASNRGYRYGDGLFETLKVIRGHIVLSTFHFERFFRGLQLLKMETPALFSPGKLEQEVLQLCKKNKCEQLARVRLSVFRGNGGLYDEDKTLQYLIECWPLSDSVNSLNENGLVTGVFPDAQKSCDRFSNLKSASFLPYSMAALYAKENKLNDCLVLNTAGNIADSTIANVFIIKEGIISTPALEEGCVNGVMRRYVIEQLHKGGNPVRETTLSVADIENAEEFFLTNAINGIRWVRQFRDAIYTCSTTAEIYNRFIKTILQ